MLRRLAVIIRNLVTSCTLSLILLASANLAVASCTVISAMPYSITSPGNYCLDRDWTTPGNGITIDADDVTVDMKGYQLSGPHTGGVVTTLQTMGVWLNSVTNRRNATIRNGRLQGFTRGVEFDGGAAGHLIENLQIVGSAYLGIANLGTNTVIRNNIITGMDGSLWPSAGGAVRGIYSCCGGGNQITNNVVSGIAPANNAESVGIFSWDSNTLIEGNFVSGKRATDTNLIGISLSYGGYNTVANNRIFQVGTGIKDQTGTGIYSGNMTNNVIVPYSGGTPKGLNF
jgi:hypothetical protein